MTLQIFGDWGFVGADNQTPDIWQDHQSCINWYPELSPAQSSKTISALLGAPGLTQVAVAPVTGAGAPGYNPNATEWPGPYTGPNLPVRGLWVLPGETQAIAVIADVCYLVTIQSVGAYATTGILNLKQVGTLATGSGPVRIRDNGIGGVVCIVDGPNGYYYVYGAGGSAVGSIGTFQKIIDPSFLGATMLAFIDGWWIFSNPKAGGNPTFYTNALPYSTAFDATLFAQKDSYSDNLVGLFEVKELLWLIGEQTSEIWYDAGGQYFAFQRMTGTTTHLGCKAPYSISRLSRGEQDGLIWLGRSDRGENVVVATKGLFAEVVSTPAVSQAISTYVTVTDAIGYTYSDDTHEFYVLTFPSADKTWVYDASMPPQYAWTQRASYDSFYKVFHRHRSNCYMNFGGMRVVGDYENGALYQMTRSAYTDAGWPLFAQRIGPIVWDKDSRGRVFVSMLQLDFTPIPSPQSVALAPPVCNLSISRDGGASFGPVVTAPIGATDKQRTLYRRLGWARNWIPQISRIDPNNRDLVGATVEAESDG